MYIFCKFYYVLGKVHTLKFVSILMTLFHLIIFINLILLVNNNLDVLEKIIPKVNYLHL